MKRLGQVLEIELLFAEEGVATFSVRAPFFQQWTMQLSIRSRPKILLYLRAQSASQIVDGGQIDYPWSHP